MTHVIEKNAHSLAPGKTEGGYQVAIAANYYDDIHHLSHRRWEMSELSLQFLGHKAAVQKHCVFRDHKRKWPVSLVTPFGVLESETNEGAFLSGRSIGGPNRCVKRKS